MTLPDDFTNSDVVMDSLTKTLGRLCLDVTNYKVVEADETIPKVEGPFILVDLSALDQLDWATNEVVDAEGLSHTVHNYYATYTLTAYRGKPQWALARVLQAFGLPWICNKYFPTGSPYAYSSSSSIARMRIPLNQQFYENRARVQINFNVTYVESDFGTFEDLEKVIIGVEIEDPTGVVIGGEESEIDVNVPPGSGEEPVEPPILPPTYHDNIVQVRVNSGY